MNKYLIIILVSFNLGSCDFFDNSKEKIHTTLRAEDPVRHYYPIIRGEDLELFFKIHNTGNQPLLIKDVQTSCGCVVAKYPKYVAEKDSSYISVKYYSGKNLGYVEAFVDVFANTDTIFKHTLKFDINVVPNADYTKDYEEIYMEKLSEQMKSLTKKWVEGGSGQKGYYTDRNETLNY